MFENCTSLSSLDLSSFNTSNVARMYEMFSNCSYLTYLNLSNFDMSHLEDTLYDGEPFVGNHMMCWKMSVSSGNCTIVCPMSVKNSLLNSTSAIPVGQVTFTWVTP